MDVFVCHLDTDGGPIKITVHATRDGAVKAAEALIFSMGYEMPRAADLTERATKAVLETGNVFMALEIEDDGPEADAWLSVAEAELET